MLLVVPFLVAGILWLAGFGPAAVTYLADCSESLSADRSALMSFYTVALAGGGAIGALLGGYRRALLGIDGLVILGRAPRDVDLLHPWTRGRGTSAHAKVAGAGV